MTTLKYLPTFLKNSFEKTAWSQQKLVCGLDEVGRGCLAGPLVVAAVILPPNRSYRLLKDSKELTFKELQLAQCWIKKNCIYSVVPLHHRLIDSANIYQATMMAMKRAVVQVSTLWPQLPSHILVDAMPLKLDTTGFGDIPVAYFTKGESKSISIAAASILAKVYRDDLLSLYAHCVPGYSLDEHKGYSTKKHKEAIKELGKSFIHRITYLSRTHCGKDSDSFGQQTLC